MQKASPATVMCPGLAGLGPRGHSVQALGEEWPPAACGQAGREAVVPEGLSQRTLPGHCPLPSLVATLPGMDHNLSISSPHRTTRAALASPQGHEGCLWRRVPASPSGGIRASLRPTAGSMVATSCSWLPDPVSCCPSAPAGALAASQPAPRTCSSCGRVFLEVSLTPSLFPSASPSTASQPHAGLFPPLPPDPTGLHPIPSASRPREVPTTLEPCLGDPEHSSPGPTPLPPLRSFLQPGSL